MGLKGLGKGLINRIDVNGRREQERERGREGE